MTQPASTEAPPADTGTGSTPSPESSRPAIEAHPGYEGQSYKWSEPEAEGGETPTPPAPETPTATPTPPAPTPPAETTSTQPTDAVKAAREAFAKGEASKEQKRLLFNEDPDFRGEVDERANTRAGHLLQQERTRIERQAQEEEHWTQIEAFKTNLDKMRDSTDPAERAKYEQWAKAPDGSKWLDEYYVGRRARDRSAASQARNGGAAAMTPEAVQELVGGWNRETAQAFAEQISSVGINEYLSDSTKRKLTSLSQEDDSKPWLHEWLADVGKDMKAHVAKVRDDALEAGRNEARAASERTSPVQIATPNIDPSRGMTPDEIMAHHAEYGFGRDDGGRTITPEQLEFAKKKKGFDY